MSTRTMPCTSNQVVTGTAVDIQQVDRPWAQPICLQGQCLTPDRVQLPEPIRLSPPVAYRRHWRYAGKSFPRDLLALTLLATTGWSSRLSLNQWLVQNEAGKSTIRSGSIRRLWTRLETRGLVQQRVIPISRWPRMQVSLVWLSDDGHRFLREMGLPVPVICEWDRLRLAHHGARQPVHTAMVILTAHHMRQRGYHTLVCPTGLVTTYRPDLALYESQTGLRYDVEVESPHRGGRAHAERLARKWRHLANYQEFVILCALNPKERCQKIESAQQVFARGLATDLVTLDVDPDITWAGSWGHLLG